MVLPQHRQDLPLRRIGRPAAAALGQRWGGQTGFHPSAEFQGVDRTSTWRQRFVESPPDDHGTTQRRNGGTRLATSTLGLFLPPQARRHLFSTCRLPMRQGPGHNAASYFTQQPVQLTLKGGHVLGRGFLMEELINQLGAMRQRAGQLPH